MPVYHATITVPRPGYLGEQPEWHISGMNELTVLFGRNGTGKSLLLRQIPVSGIPGVTFIASPERAGDVQFDQNLLAAQLQGDRGSDRRQRNLVPEYRRQSITRVAAVQNLIGNLHGHGLPAKDWYFSFMESQLQNLLPGFAFKVIGQPPFFQMFRVKADHTAEPVHDLSQQLSSGETEALTLALDLMTICCIWDLEDHEERLLLVDEPDPHLHTDMQVRLARLVLKLIEQFRLQVIVATHSSSMLAALGHFAGERLSVVYLGANDSTLTATPHNRVFDRLLGVLGGHALVAPLLGAPMLLVEGDDDYTIWSHVPRSPHTKEVFAVVPCNGQEIREHQKLLEKVIGSIRDPSQDPVGYVLLDRDMPRPTDLPEEHIAFIQLSCLEAENLYLADEVLSTLGTTWEDAQALISQRAGDFGDAARPTLESVADWDRRATDLKAVIRALPRILDAKLVPWQVRVGQVLAASRPTGMLADFLGDEVVLALWGPPQ